MSKNWSHASRKATQQRARGNTNGRGNKGHKYGQIPESRRAALRASWTVERRTEARARMRRLWTQARRAAQTRRLQQYWAQRRADGTAGMRTIKGYVCVLMLGHPRASKRTGYVKRATVALERKIGRFLQPRELAHHRDGNKTNDAPDNLVLLTHLAHARLHGRQRHCLHVLMRISAALKGLSTNKLEVQRELTYGA